MMNWTTKKLGDILELEYGKSLTKSNRVDGKYPIFGSSGVVGTNNNFLVKSPGIIIGRKGSVGKIYFSNKNFYPIDTVYFIRNNPDKYNIRYLYYFLKNLNLKRLSGDVGVPGLNRNTAYDEIVKFPADDIETQTRIASVLSSYDDLIENNEKRIKALEEMAQLLYTEWFVRFKFPNHENVKMVESGTEYGEVPEGWEVVSIESLLSKVKRKSKIQSTEYVTDGSFPIVDQGKEFIGGYTENKEAVYDQDLIVFGDHSRCFKYCNFPFASGADGTQLLLTNDPARMPEILLYFVVINSGLTNYNYARHFKFLKAIKVIKPDSTIATKFGAIVAQSFSMIRELRNQNKNLSKTRDLLIPQLVTGRRELTFN